MIYYLYYRVHGWYIKNNEIIPTFKPEQSFRLNSHKFPLALPSASKKPIPCRGRSVKVPQVHTE